MFVCGSSWLLRGGVPVKLIDGSDRVRPSDIEPLFRRTMRDGF
jgi:hypothetical protein